MPLLQADGREFECSAVLLDKDGTLLDFKVMWLEWSRFVIEEIMANAGMRLDAGALERAMGIDLAGWHVDPEGPLAGGTMTGLRQSLEVELKLAGIDADTATALIKDASRRSETAMDWGALTRPVPGLQEKLEDLKRHGLKLAVVTADLTERSKNSMVTLQLIDYFDVVIGADLVRNTKPAADMALLACSLLNVAPGTAVVVGDTPRDIIMAKNAGAASIGVLSGVCTREQLASAAADAVVESVTALRVSII